MRMRNCVILLALSITALYQLAVAQNEYDVRLIGGISKRDGILQVFFNNQWGTVCNDGFDTKDASVICYQLGYIRSQSRAVDGTTEFDTSILAPNTPKHFTGLSCEGNENVFQECQRSQPPTALQCTQLAGVYCLGAIRTTIPPTTTTLAPTTTTTPPPRICNNPSTNVRLIDGANEAVGRVQVRRDGNSAWGEICDDLWGQNDAAVICRMLCFNPTNARAYLGGIYGPPDGQYILNNLLCSGAETDVFSCPVLSIGKTQCSNQEAASLSCLEPAPTPPPLPTPEIECDGTVERIVATFKKINEPDLKPDYLSLSNTTITKSCGYTTGENSTHVFISVPFTACGTKRSYNFTSIIYSVWILHDIPPKSIVISRTEPYNINVSCVMDRNGDPEADVEALGRTAPPQQGSGHPDLQLNIYDSSKFVNKKASLPAEVFLGDTVYVGMLLVTEDPMLKVILQECYATPNISTDSEPKYYLIWEKCSNETTIQFYPLNETFYGFSYQSFKFFGDQFSVVYLHCKGIVCGLDEFYPRCDRTCGTGVGVVKRSVDNLEEYQAEDVPSSYYRRYKRQIAPFEIEVVSGPIYILERPKSTSPTPLTATGSVIKTSAKKVIATSPISETSKLEGHSIDGVTLKSSNHSDDRVTSKPSNPSIIKGEDMILGDEIEDDMISSTATLLQFTLSMFICMILTLIIH